MDREKEIRREMYEKETEKRKIIKDLKRLRNELMEVQGMQHLDKGAAKTKKKGGK